MGMASLIHTYFTVPHSLSPTCEQSITAVGVVSINNIQQNQQHNNNNIIPIIITFIDKSNILI